LQFTDGTQDTHKHLEQVDERCWVGRKNGVS